MPSPEDSDDRDWRLTGRARSRAPASRRPARAASSGCATRPCSASCARPSADDVVITHDGNRLFAYAAGPRAIEAGPQAIQAVLDRDGIRPTLDAQPLLARGARRLGRPGRRSPADPERERRPRRRLARSSRRRQVDPRGIRGVDAGWAETRVELRDPRANPHLLAAQVPSRSPGRRASWTSSPRVCAPRRPRRSAPSARS